MTPDERRARIAVHEAALWSIWHDLSPDQFVLMVAGEFVRLEGLVLKLGGDPTEQWGEA